MCHSAFKSLNAALLNFICVSILTAAAPKASVYRPPASINSSYVEVIIQFDKDFRREDMESQIESLDQRYSAKVRTYWFCASQADCAAISPLTPRLVEREYCLARAKRRNAWRGPVGRLVVVGGKRQLDFRASPNVASFRSGDLAGSLGASPFDLLYLYGFWGQLAGTEEGLQLSVVLWSKDREFCHSHSDECRQIVKSIQAATGANDLFVVFLDRPAYRSDPTPCIHPFVDWKRLSDVMDVGPALRATGSLAFGEFQFEVIQ